MERVERGGEEEVVGDGDEGNYNMPANKKRI